MFPGDAAVKMLGEEEVAGGAGLVEADPGRCTGGHL
jgi:hypothetical protein